ncbi:phosphatases II [Calocera viscosa TUFC12733]|uniref:Phosphatases II n=1 Tax=Calocera viscosa (strain TUFC12733) TaxID=1330018 RepID=A0A167RW77_CALVF|nr:phosphatases II [Calocera viscosa TUFC12733]
MSYVAQQDMPALPGKEWRYEMRRECQEIIPGLLLGPFQVSKDLDTLLSLGVTHILCIRDPKEAFLVKERFPERFRYLVLNVVDNDEQNLISLFNGPKQFIYDAINSGGTVLVHCNGGISLSPTFVILFIMQHNSMSYTEALHYVQNKRYCISPNTGFMAQLKEYEPIYRAQKAILAMPARPERTMSNRRKRDEDEDDETEWNSRRPHGPMDKQEDEDQAMDVGA